MPRRAPDNRLFDVAAPAWDRVMGRWGIRPVLEALALGAPAPGPLLDLAGGTGRVADRLELGPRPLVVADLSRSMTRRARRKGHAALRVRGEALPLADGSVARILILDALHHMAHRRRVLDETARVLAPGGLLVLFEPDPERWLGRLVRAGERLMRMGSRFATGAELSSWLQQRGLEPHLARSRGHLLVQARKAPDARRGAHSSARKAAR